MGTEDKVVVWEKMAQISPDFFCTFDREGNFLNVNNASLNIIGYSSDYLIGRHYSEFLHPDFISRSYQVGQDIINGQDTNNFENCFVHHNGQAVFIQWSSIWSEPDQVFFSVGRNITELKKSRLELEEREQRYKALFDFNPDVIFVQNNEGLITEVNQSFGEVFGIKKEEAVNLPASFFLPPDKVLECEEHFRETLLGNIQRFKLELETKSKGRRIFETVKFPLLLNGEVVGTQSVAKDITPILQSFDTIQKQATTLNTIFESITDAFYTLDKSWNFTYLNQEAERLLGKERTNLIGKNAWKTFLEESDRLFYQQYHYAVETGKAVHFEAFYSRADIWVEVKAFPSAEGLSVYFDDITEKVKARKELEKLSLVASKTTNGVIITNKARQIEWVNEGFTRLTGYSPEEALGNIPSQLLHNSRTDNQSFGAVKDKMLRGEAVAFEVLNSRKNGEDLWLSIQVNPIFNEQGELERYVTIQSDITERKKEQRELEKLSLVASNTTNGVIITNREREIEWVNEGFTRLTGYHLAEALGKTPYDLLARPDSDEKEHEADLNKIKAGEPVNFEIINARKNGEALWTSVQVNPIYNENGDLMGQVSLLTDITDLVKAQKELEKLSWVASKTTNGVVITDANGLTEWVNESFTQITGYTLPEVIGKKPGTLLQGKETEAETVQIIRAKLRQGVYFNAVLVNYKKSGEKFWVSMDITPIYDNSGKIIQFIAIQKDITFRKEAEDQLMKLTQDLNKQNNDLQQFTYIVSHNLRSPVANALGLADLLTKIDKNSELYDKAVANIKESVLKLDSVLRDMNTILNIRDTKQNVEPEPVLINAIIQQVVTSLQEPLLKCSGEVVNHIPDDLGSRANKAYLYSIFYNLLSNAIKYQSEDRLLQVRIECVGKSEKGMLIAFSDNGSGFDMKVAKDNIFRLYKRFHKNIEGRGMGLYLIKTHLDAMGGHIEVNSEAGAGTRFLMYLPNM